MKKKVYCKNCKYLNKAGHNWFTDKYRCNLELDFAGEWNGTYCKDKNKNCLCMDYHRKFWKVWVR